MAGRIQLWTVKSVHPLCVLQVYCNDSQLEAAADNIAQRVMIYKCEREAGHELQREELAQLRPFIDEHLMAVKQQAAKERAQRGPVTSY